MNTSESDSPIRQDVQSVRSAGEPADQTEPTSKNSSEPKLRKPPRLWPGIIAAVLLVLFRFVVPAVAPNAMIFGVPGFALGLLGAFICALLILLWWLFFSRLPWVERLAAIPLIIFTLFITNRLVHESISGGAMGNLLYVLAIPVLCLALVVWAVFSQRLRLSLWPRRIALAGILFLVGALFLPLRTGGITSSFDNDFHWRWSKTPEDHLVAQGEEPAGPIAPAINTLDWPGFRGPQRDGIVRGVQIKTDWASSPPVEMWRRPVGPGWSSFSVQNGRFYTQEQRGAQELVACYDVATGKQVWKHGDSARFYESNGGAGPRGTPTLHNGRVYALGATGILNVLDAATGEVIWSRNAVNDTGAKIPAWGISASPLIVNDLVIVAASGTLAAYDLANGTPRWVGPAGRASYSSPHLVTIGGVPQVVLLNADGATAFSPADGTRLWAHAWDGVPIVQPNVTGDGDMLIAVSESSGTRRLAVAKGANGWTAEERWTSEDMNPYFNDFVIHKGHAYGFNGNSVVCIDLANGTRKWRGGGYGNGQLVLLADQDLLVILSEEGDIALVKAVSDQFTELARRPGIKGKTWNHPVLAGGILLLRNSEEMAAYRLSLAGT
ncbi:MAG TPA: PQQ-binding-like beta-propeller repeat protein [Pyrinomonadaceae bacterium]|nr:PQQ-binding-like beta-propeller repeat protein [Pyrinomonadaceae bacterium]